MKNIYVEPFYLKRLDFALHSLLHSRVWGKFHLRTDASVVILSDSSLWVVDRH